MMRRGFQNKKGLSAIFTALVLLVLTGCPYESRVALGDSKDEKIDTSLIGEWYSVDNKTDTMNINIHNFNSTEYLIEYNETRLSSKKPTTLLRGFISKIGNYRILNINEIEVDSKYTFFKYDLDGDKLKIAYVSDNFNKTQFDTESKIYKYFEENIDKKDFFEDVVIFKKK